MKMVGGDNVFALARSASACVVDVAADCRSGGRGYGYGWAGESVNGGLGHA